ncbi:MAG: cell division protein SepF [Clostridium sp.]
MSILNKIMDTMRLTGTDDDDYFMDDDYDDDDDNDKPAKKKLFNKKDDLDDDYEEAEAKPHFLSRSSSKIVPMKRGMEVSLVKPTSMEDSREICDYLLAGKAVVLNMEGIHMEVAQRIIDFASGATYSMNGNLQKISNYIFIATPATVELSGDFQEMLADGSLNISGLNLHL